MMYRDLEMIVALNTDTSKEAQNVQTEIVAYMDETHSIL